jgi:hypothetical protein
MQSGSSCLMKKGETLESIKDILSPKKSAKELKAEQKGSLGPNELLISLNATEI